MRSKENEKDIELISSVSLTTLLVGVALLRVDDEPKEIKDVVDYH